VLVDGREVKYTNLLRMAQTCPKFVEELLQQEAAVTITADVETLRSAHTRAR
jgi:hypothetical protein